MGKFLRNRIGGVSTGAVVAIVLAMALVGIFGMYFVSQNGGGGGTTPSPTTPPPSSGDVRNGLHLTFKDPNTGTVTSETYTIYIVDEANPAQGTGDMGDCHSDIEAAATAHNYKLTGTINSGVVEFTASDVGEQTWKDNDFYVLVYADGDTDFWDAYYGPYYFQWVGADYDFTNGPKQPIEIYLYPIPSISMTYWGTTILNADWSSDAVKASENTTDFSSAPETSATPWYVAQCEQLLITGGTLDQLKPHLAGYNLYWIWYEDDNDTYENDFYSFRYGTALSTKTVSTYRWSGEDREYLKFGDIHAIQSWFKLNTPYVVTFQNTTGYPSSGTDTTSVPYYFYVGESVTDEYVLLGSGTITHTS